METAIRLSALYSHCVWSTPYHFCAAMVSEKVFSECFGECGCEANCRMVWDHESKWHMDKLDKLSKELIDIGAGMSLSPAKGVTQSIDQFYFYYPEGNTFDGFLRMWDLYIKWYGKPFEVKGDRMQQLNTVLLSFDPPVLHSAGRLYYVKEIKQVNLITVDGKFYEARPV